MGCECKARNLLGNDSSRIHSLCGGLHAGGGMGIVFAIVGAGLLFISGAGFYKIKPV